MRSLGHSIYGNQGHERGDKSQMSVVDNDEDDDDDGDAFGLACYSSITVSRKCTHIHGSSPPSSAQATIS